MNTGTTNTGGTHLIFCSKKEKNNSSNKLQLKRLDNFRVILGFFVMRFLQDLDEFFVFIINET